MFFEEIESGWVILTIPESQYAGMAVALSNLCFLVDPNIDESELYDEFLDMIGECEGEITFGDIVTCVNLAKSTRFNPNYDYWV